MSGAPKRILVSGFEAFGGASINPTAILCELLEKTIAENKKVAVQEESADIHETGIQIPSNVEVLPVLLPVTFSEAYLRLREKIEEFDPHAIVSLGQAGGRDAIELERVAINIIDANIPDNSGALIRDEPVLKEGPAAHFSTLPLRRLLEDLKNESIPARISNSAGTYVCNSLLYQMLEGNRSSGRHCGFVHVPYLPEQVSADAKDRPVAPSMSLETMIRALNSMLRTLARP